MYQFHLSIGDWSGDGHGRSEDFTVASNAPVEIVREAHFSFEGQLCRFHQGRPV